MPTIDIPDLLDAPDNGFLTITLAPAQTLILALPTGVILGTSYTKFADNALLTAILIDANSAAVPLTGAAVVAHIARRYDLSLVMSAPCVFTTVAGQVVWNQAALAVGEYAIEFLATFPDGTIVRFPDNGNAYCWVLADLA